MMRRLIGVIFIFLSVICLAIAIGKDKNLIHRMVNNIFFIRPHNLTLEQKIVLDLNSIKKKEIPSNLMSLHQVFWQDHRSNKRIKDLISTISPLFPISKDGKYLLQIDCFDSDSQLILQMSFFDEKTKNKVFEISRDYPTTP